MCIDRIFLSGKHVDEELRRILLEIQDSFFLREDFIDKLEKSNKINLEEYSNLFIKYFLLIKQLHDYYKNNLKDYYYVESYL